MQRKGWVIHVPAEVEQVFIAQSLPEHKNHGCRSAPRQRRARCASDDEVAALENDEKETALRRRDGHLLREVKHKISSF